jgi:hypothetical protein
MLKREREGRSSALLDLLLPALPALKGWPGNPAGKPRERAWDAVLVLRYFETHYTSEAKASDRRDNIMTR